MQLPQSRKQLKRLRTSIKSKAIAFCAVAVPPNPAFERDAAKARRPSTLRWAPQRDEVANQHMEYDQ